MVLIACNLSKYLALPRSNLHYDVVCIRAEYIAVLSSTAISGCTNLRTKIEENDQN